MHRASCVYRGDARALNIIIIVHIYGAYNVIMYMRNNIYCIYTTFEHLNVYVRERWPNVADCQLPDINQRCKRKISANGGGPKRIKKKKKNRIQLLFRKPLCTRRSVLARIHHIIIIIRVRRVCILFKCKAYIICTYMYTRIGLPRPRCVFKRLLSAMYTRVRLYYYIL